MEIGIYSTIIISILGIAYPILLQVISRLDETYSSSLIIDLFEREFYKKWFQIQLYVSLIILFIWSLKLEPIEPFSKLGFLIDKSAIILLVTTTILLVITFFLLVHRIFVYSIPSKFIKYAISIHDEKKKNESMNFEALIDVFLNNIDVRNYKIVKTLSRFFYNAFKEERENSSNQYVTYPEIYYELVYKTVEKLANINDTELKYLNNRTIGSIWLLGELQNYGISEMTYSWIWRNLRLAIQNKRDDMILDHWETVNQYITYNLRIIHPEYNHDVSGNFEILNQDQVTKREQERKRFVMFHYALGGLLIYKKRYDCIKEIFEYTASIPPKYELLPESMTEIFQYFDEFRDPYEEYYMNISNTYPFPDLRGLNADYTIKQWICSYIALLFLRQYTIIPHLITMRPLDYPKLPESQAKVKQWLDGLAFFKKLLTLHLENKDLISATGLSFITYEWCKAKDIDHPVIFVNKLKELLNNAYHENALNLTIDQNRVKKFEISTKGIIEDTLESLNPINNDINIEIDSDKWFIKGQRMIQSKDAFSKNSEVDYGKYDSILASVLSDEIYRGIATTFLLKKSKTYILEPENIFRGINKLEINDKDYLIICFGFNFNYYINQLKVPLSYNKYKNIDIYSFSKSILRDSSLFILKKSDLPNISTIEIDSSIKEKYSLNKISESYNLYTSVIDLNNTTKEIFNENKENREDDELRKSVLMSIIINIEIKWKKKVNIIHFIEFSKYRQKGLPSSIKEIEPFK